MPSWFSYTIRSIDGLKSVGNHSRSSSSSANSLSNDHVTKCHYAVLGVSNTADYKTIKEAYIDLSKKYHPDTRPFECAAHDRYVRINEAYSILSKCNTRGLYDLEMGYRQWSTTPLDHDQFHPLTPNRFSRYDGCPNSFTDLTNSWNSRTPGSTQNNSSFVHDIVYGYAIFLAILCVTTPISIIVLLMMSPVGKQSRRLMAKRSARSGLVQQVMMANGSNPVE